ncbi:MAG: hypothetical protein OEU36_12180 [Gammaproteobacteria bacterium]|nr:hypothetical protein [Gammaproteobacteria bacterium]
MTEVCQRKDWVSDHRSYAVAWGLPTAGLIIGAFLSAPIKVSIWSVALVWMGVACLLNARRCGRRHCYLTGPFFLLMAVVVVLYGFDVIWLGDKGFLWLAVTVVIGGYGLLWKLPEYLWGKYVNRET